MTRLGFNLVPAYTDSTVPPYCTYGASIRCELHFSTRARNLSGSLEALTCEHTLLWSRLFIWYVGGDYGNRFRYLSYIELHFISDFAFAPKFFSRAGWVCCDTIKVLRVRVGQYAGFHSKLILTSFSLYKIIRFSRTCTIQF